MLQIWKKKKKREELVGFSWNKTQVPTPLIYQWTDVKTVGNLGSHPSAAQFEPTSPTKNKIK